MNFILLAPCLMLFCCFASEPTSPLVGQQTDFTSEYEKVINEYTKYLSGVHKTVKEEELRYLEEVAKVDKEISKLNQQKVALKAKLSDALKEHQATKLVFDKKLYFLSKSSSHRPLRKKQPFKKTFKKKDVFKKPSQPNLNP